MKAVDDLKKKKKNARLWEGARRGGMAVEFFTSPCSPWALLPGGKDWLSPPEFSLHDYGVLGVFADLLCFKWLSPMALSKGCSL